MKLDHVRALQQGAWGCQKSTGVQKSVSDTGKNKLLGVTAVPERVDSGNGLKQINSGHLFLQQHTYTDCGFIVNVSVPGHLYSFLACAMSPLLSLVR